MSDFLEYVIRETGQTCVSRRDEQQDDMLDYLKHVAAAATTNRMEAVL